MSDFEYENGEDYMGSIDPGFSEIADAAYEQINENMPEETYVNWFDVSRKYFGMEVPDKENKAQWYLYVGARNALMNAVNHRAENYGQSWRLFVVVPGESVTKATRSQMVDRMVEKRIKRVASSFRLNERHLTPMLSYDDITPRDRRIIQEMLSVSQGAKLVTAGAIERLESLTADTKTKLLSAFGIDR